MKKEISEGIEGKKYRFPFSPYPYSWYQVASSSDIAPGSLKTIRFFNKDFVLFRTQDGKVAFSSAYCPHLGAHMGVNGKVDEKGLRCPFHSWKFNAEGECVEIPYCDTIPKKARLETYPIIEKNGVIFIFYGENYQEIHERVKQFPPEKIPDYPEFQKENKKFWSKPIVLRYKIPSHVQEMAENATDMAHFPLVHQYYKVPEVAKVEETDSQFSIRFVGLRKVFKIENKIDVELNAVGLGVVFGKTVTNLVSVRAIHAVTPIDEHHLQVTVTVAYNKNWNYLRSLFFNLFLKREIYYFTNGDRIVLGNKIYKNTPILCKNDGPIYKLRRWAEKFY